VKRLKQLEAIEVLSWMITLLSVLISAGSINIRWLGQILVLVGTLVYGYYRIETRLGTLETELADANERIGDLLNKHILEERAEREELSKKITFYEKEFNINPLSWGKKRRK
jgi:hypothetical protein